MWRLRKDTVERFEGTTCPGIGDVGAANIAAAIELLG